MDELVILFDVDNTLLDNDRIQTDLATHLTAEFGEAVSVRYFAIFEQIRAELGYADYLGALQRYRIETMHDPRVLRMASWLADYDFAARLYPGALEVLAHARRFGRPVILSDGDAVFQPLKVVRSGLWSAVKDDVLIYVHKEAELADVERLYPARRYIMVDDKRRILTAMKREWGERLTTVFPRQGHYAADPATLAQNPPADLSIDHVAELLHLDLSSLRPTRA